MNVNPNSPTPAPAATEKQATAVPSSTMREDGVHEDPTKDTVVETTTDDPTGDAPQAALGVVGFNDLGTDADGRVYAGTTRFENKIALRPAIANWRIRQKDIDLFIDVVRELAKKLES